MVSIRFATAELAGANASDDRVFRTPYGVVVLDGASSHTDDHLMSGGEYAERLGSAVAARIGEPLPLTDVVRDSIATVAHQLRLRSMDVRPSSTIAIVRVAGEMLDVFVLGDSVVVVKRKDGRQDVITDDRLSMVELPEAEKYRGRLAAGGGYDRRHTALLAELQRAEREHRNQPGGFWIAAEVPEAADKAVLRSIDLNEVDWAAVATDGVADVLEAADESWDLAAELDSAGLADQLARLHRWEANVDPHGMLRPRAKRHDDKAIAVLRFE
ncbi:protein phosphatase 2C domain-containing protein [Nocardia goodfellowii]